MPQRPVRRREVPIGLRFSGDLYFSGVATSAILFPPRRALSPAPLSLSDFLRKQSLRDVPPCTVDVRT